MNRLPERRPTCDAELSEYPFYQIVPGPFGRLLRRIAVWLLPCMALVYLAVLLLGSRALGFGTGHGYFAVALIGGPSLLLYALSNLVPKRRRVICLHCSCNQEFDLEPHRNDRQAP